MIYVPLLLNMDSVKRPLAIPHSLDLLHMLPISNRNGRANFAQTTSLSLSISLSSLVVGQSPSSTNSPPLLGLCTIHAIFFVLVIACPRFFSGLLLPKVLCC